MVLYYRSNGRKPELERRWAEMKAESAAVVVVGGRGEEAQTQAVAAGGGGAAPLIEGEVLPPGIGSGGDG